MGKLNFMIYQIFFRVLEMYLMDTGGEAALVSIVSGMYLRIFLLKLRTFVSRFDDVF